MSLVKKIINTTAIVALLALIGADIYLSKKLVKEMNKYSLGGYRTLGDSATTKRHKETDSTHGIDIRDYLIRMEGKGYNLKIKKYIVLEKDEKNTVYYYPLDDYDPLKKQKASFRDFVSSTFKTKRN